MGGAGAKFNFYQNMVMLHIKLKGMTNVATCTPSTPEVGSKVKKSFVSERSHDAYQIYWNGA